MNNVVIMGRLTSDPEVRYTQDNLAVARYSLAVDRVGKKGEADYIPVVAFGKGGEFAEKYFRKGLRVCVQGHIQTGSYEGKNGKVYTTDVIAEKQEFADGKGGNIQPQEKTAANGQNGGNLDGFMRIPDDINEELPFV